MIVDDSSIVVHVIDRGLLSYIDVYLSNLLQSFGNDSNSMRVMYLIY